MCNNLEVLVVAVREMVEYLNRRLSLRVVRDAIGACAVEIRGAMGSSFLVLMRGSMGVRCKEGMNRRNIRAKAHYQPVDGANKTMVDFCPTLGVRVGIICHWD